MSEKPATQPTPAEQPARGGAINPSPWRVLIADDDPNIRQLLELALSDDGFETIGAADGY